MPKKGQFNTYYQDLLLMQNGIKLLEQFKGAKQHHSMQCTVCQHIWKATPISKLATYKRWKASGCPSCNLLNKEVKAAPSRLNNLQNLANRGIEVLTPGYDGRLRSDYNLPIRLDKILVKNIQCGHQFLVSPLNLIQSTVVCGVCGPTLRVAPLTAWSKANSEKWRLTATEWEAYKSKVRSYTGAAYKKHKSIINPDDLPTGLAGIDGVYHLDHIVPKRWCFDNGVPAKVCGHHTNLQMLAWKDNITFRDNIKDINNIPSVLIEYVERACQSC